MTDLARLVAPAVAVVGDAYRKMLVARAHDVTGEIAATSALVLAPHPDDETLACGVTIARKARSGTAVTVVIATDGTASHSSSGLAAAERAAMRRDEAGAAVSVLGLDPLDTDNLLFLDHPDGHLADHLDALSSQLEDLLSTFSPDEIYVPSSIDWNDDHRAMSEVARKLIARKGIAATVLEYPVWFYEPWAWMDRNGAKASRIAQLLSRPVKAAALLRPQIVKSGEFAIVKEQAVAEYRSQLTNITGEDDWAVFPEAFLERQLAPEELFFNPLRSTDGRNPVEVAR